MSCMKTKLSKYHFKLDKLDGLGKLNELYEKLSEFHL